MRPRSSRPTQSLHSLSHETTRSSSSCARSRELLRLDEPATRLARRRSTGRLEERPVEPDERRRPLDDELLERAQHPAPRALAVDVVDDELRDRAGRRGPRSRRPPSRRSRRARRCPPGSRYAVMRPGAGRKPRATSSALIRHSIAWPRRTTSSWASESGSPAAMSICSRTRSIPVTASVTVCSTWMRVFISRK